MLGYLLCHELPHVSAQKLADCHVPRCLAKPNLFGNSLHSTRTVLAGLAGTKPLNENRQRHGCLHQLSCCTSSALNAAVDVRGSPELLINLFRSQSSSWISGGALCSSPRGAELNFSSLPPHSRNAGSAGPFNQRREHLDPP